MQCPKCQSDSSALAQMALARGLHLGSSNGQLFPGSQINAAVLPLIGPNRPQPTYLFFVVGAIIIGIGFGLGFLFAWELRGLWGGIAGIGAFTTLWPLVSSSYRQRQIEAFDKHQEFLKSNWFCFSCGHTWPQA